jgi:hypothetical protein
MQLAPHQQRREPGSRIAIVEHLPQGARRFVDGRSEGDSLVDRAKIAVDLRAFKGGLGFNQRSDGGDEQRAGAIEGIRVGQPAWESCRSEACGRSAAAAVAWGGRVASAGASC